ncbi:MAG: hypothetical protein LKE77_08240 [Companilactobacillus sp.]|jgi:polyhydroxyalkanoate synthesis regulator phasin|uniref:hypothetical protein n=1 Tax=Companilactobacillus sp. TaxID=2767905 RepID=UPI0025BA25F9|nr:hypothetical protein [Companilactobacillus sp.]MCH4010378.1 hypothetical protein [Companilactobacillus sp.]MCH4051946.1 hypothetical protein [Companilactobacillus sp.]MCH4075818.1 hypothetical protein [Companilactobacillus sp.]MCH4126896.1 hypothetical protein [Companilactobacillus sp.]
MTKIMQLSDFEGNKAYAKTHADDDSVEGLTNFVNSLIKGTSTNIDLTDYFTKEEIKQLLSDSIKDSLKDYYTKEEVKELMATGTDLSDYYTKEQIDSIIEKIPKTDLSNYYTKADVDELIKQISSVDFSNYSTTDEMKTAISDAIKEYKPDMSDYYDKTTVDNKIAQSNGNTTDLSQYLTKVETIDVINDAITEKLDNYYTKTETDSAIMSKGGFSPETTVIKSFLNGWKGQATLTKLDKLVVFQVLISSGATEEQAIFEIPKGYLPDLSMFSRNKAMIFTGQGFDSSLGSDRTGSFVMDSEKFYLRSSDFFDSTRTYNIYGSYYIA